MKGNKPTVLLADDEESVRELLLQLLQREKCEVVAVAGDGEEALQLYQQYKPDITLLDIKMPKLDGMGVLRKIREQDKESFICIISADAFPDILREAAKLRVAGYVVKPIVGKKTRSIINKYEKHRSKEKLPPSVISDKKPFQPSERELINAQWLIDSIQFPAVPEAVTALQKEMAKSEPDVDYVTEIISGEILIRSHHWR
ncbi:MAG: response regulator [Gammaproteobacteria bacterium]|jgi:YesN/AraC family two-component response regulator|nr:response regulator [Gammaproteobacteria bacterium]MBT5745782.1 response regulator [Gammaproteobacteria bacterium]